MRSEMIKVWTIQNQLFIDNLNRDEIISGEKLLIEEQWAEFIEPFDWMIQQMSSRNLNPEKKYPIWLWNKKPDRRLNFFKWTSEQFILELEVPKDQILWSNFEHWHCILNGYPLFTQENNDELVTYYEKKYNGLPKVCELNEEDKKEALLKWEDIFKLLDVEKEKQRDLRYLQGCISQISVDQIKKITPLKVKKK